MIKIDDEFLINATDSCYTLETINTVQDTESKNYGKETRTIQGYYTSIENALNGYLKCKTRKYVGLADTKTIHDLINYIKELEEIIKDNFRGLDNG